MKKKFFYVRIEDNLKFARVLWFLQIDPEEEPPPPVWVEHVEVPNVLPNQVEVIGIFWNFTDQPKLLGQLQQVFCAMPLQQPNDPVQLREV